MNHRMRRIVETLACERRYGIADAKGSEYSGAGSTYKETGADTLRNFKAVAERIGGTSEQVLLTYLLKHIDSITTTVREAGIYGGPNGLAEFQREKYAAGEGIVSRLDDARNYLDLLECLLMDNGRIYYPDNCDPESVAVAMQDAVDAAEQFIKDYSPVIGVKTNDPNGVTLEEFQQNQALANAGLHECLDGVWRGKTTIDSSVKTPGERQTPIYAQPAVFEPTMDKVRTEPETGELA